jgi:heat shock protein HtpX
LYAILNFLTFNILVKVEANDMNRIKTVFLMTLMAVILMAIGGAIGGRSGVMVMFILATAMNFFSYWFSDSLVLRAYHAQQVDESHPLYQIVADLAQRAGLPMPQVYIIPTDMPNAFATGRSPSHAAVAATEGILEMLDEDEIRGVLAHEMSHVLHWDILISTIVASFASAISMIANIAQWAAIFGGGRSDDDNGGGNIITLLVTIIVAPLAASLVQLGISRTREYMADEEGGRMIDDPLALARALAKMDNYAHYGVLPGATKATAHMCIINPFSGTKSAMANLFSTHPPTEKRIERLQELDHELHG